MSKQTSPAIAAPADPACRARCAALRQGNHARPRHAAGAGPAVHRLQLRRATDFFSLQNLSIVTQQASINIVLAAGMTFVILTGGIDLSVGSILAASAMVGDAGVELCRSSGMLGIAGGAGLRAAVRPRSTAC